MRSIPVTIAVAFFLGAMPATAQSPVPDRHVRENSRSIVVPAASRDKRAAPELPPPLAEVRKRMIAGRSVAYRDLQALADAGDGIAAFRLGQMIEGRADPAVLSDALHYYAMSASLGRSFAVGSVVRILSRSDAAFRDAHLRQAEQALLRQAAKGNDQAVKFLIRFYALGKPFGDRQLQAEALLKGRAGKADGAAAYQLAVMLLSGKEREPEIRLEAIRYLKIAIDHGNVGTSASAANLLRTLSANDPTEEDKV